MVNTQLLLLAPDLVATQFEGQEDPLQMDHDGHGRLTVVSGRNSMFCFENGTWSDIPLPASSGAYVMIGTKELYLDVDRKEVKMYEFGSGSLDHLWTYFSYRSILWFSQLDHDRMICMTSQVNHFILSISTGKVLYQNQNEKEDWGAYQFGWTRSTVVCLNNETLYMIDCSTCPSTIVRRTFEGAEGGTPRNVWFSFDGTHMFVSLLTQIWCYSFPSLQLVWNKRYLEPFYEPQLDGTGRYIALSMRHGYLICSSTDGSILYKKRMPATEYWWALTPPIFSRDSSKLIFGRNQWLCVLQLFPKEKQALRSLFAGKPSVSQTISKVLRGKMYVF